MSSSAPVQLVKSGQCLPVLLDGIAAKPWLVVSSSAVLCLFPALIHLFLSSIVCGSFSKFPPQQHILIGVGLPETGNSSSWSTTALLTRASWSLAVAEWRSVEAADVKGECGLGNNPLSFPQLKGSIPLGTHSSAAITWWLAEKVWNKQNCQESQFGECQGDFCRGRKLHVSKWCLWDTQFKTWTHRH